MTRENHLAALEALGMIPGRFCALRRIELEAHRSATARCNGDGFEGQPFRPDWDPATGEETSKTPWSTYRDSIRLRVSAVFGGRLPGGFLFNQDPRGYALKLAPGSFPAGMVTDWGGFGILAPSREGFK